MGSGSTLIETGRSLLVPGLMINSRELDRRFGQMGCSMRASFRRVSSMARGLSNLNAGRRILVSFRTTRFPATEPTTGRMDGSTRGTGLTTKCTAMENSHGQTENRTPETIRTTLKMVMECSNGPTDESTPANG
jgi:hypothetical protein